VVKGARYALAESPRFFGLFPRRPKASVHDLLYLFIDQDHHPRYHEYYFHFQQVVELPSDPLPEPEESSTHTVYCGRGTANVDRS
jgi:hypothetical protein